MASSSSSPSQSSPTPYITQIPTPPSSPSHSGDKFLEEEKTLVPIHMVTKAFELPANFLHPSPHAKLVVGLDCEAIDYGTVSIIQLEFPDAIYLVDAIEGGTVLIEACKPALESEFVTKVTYDCKRDSETLYFQYGIKFNNVVDTKIAYTLLEEQEGQKRCPDDYISLVAQYRGLSHVDMEEGQQDPNIWTTRPLSEQMIYFAAADVRFLLYIHQQMMPNLIERSSWKLAIRSALYCRCFCVDSNNNADWPSLPPVPDTLNIDGNGPEEEILSVLDVPPDKMEAFIMAIKESCNMEILIGGPRGPPNKVFIIGPVKQVKKVEDMLRGGVNMNILDKKMFYSHFYEEIEEIKDKEMVDPFEGLSNELILHIQRSFTTKDLTATMQLSKRWRDLWLQNPGLKFQQSFNHNLNNSEDVKLFASQVDSMISFRFGSRFDKTHPVVDFEISLDFSLQMYTAVETFVASRLFQWVTLLKSKGVTRLTIKMGMIPNDDHVDLYTLVPQIPFPLMGYNQLSDLKLHGLRFPDLKFWKCNFLLLQNLSICWVFFKHDTHFVRLVEWCPKLRTLSAIDINALEIVEKAEGFYNKFSLPNLESAEIYRCRCFYDLHAFSAVRTLKLQFDVSYAGDFPIFRNLLHLTLKEDTPSRYKKTMEINSPGVRKIDYF